MRVITDIGGVRIGLDGTDGPDHHPEPAAPDLDLLRVRQPADGRVPRLLATGHLIRPSDVTWLAPTGASATGFLSRLSAKDRRNVRAAERSLAAQDARIGVEPVGVGLLDDFLAVYTRALAAMPNGIPVAVKERDAVLVDASAYYAVTVRQGGQLVAGCLAVHDAGRDLVRVRFSAAEAHLRDASVTRVLYLTAVGEARERGVGQVSLGSDINLYGHIVQPGLFSFKCRLGFAPYPSQTAGDGGYDLAERILDLGRLAEPTLTLAYAPTPDGSSVDRSAPLDLHVFSRRSDPDLRPYRASFVGAVRVHQVASGHG